MQLFQCRHAVRFLAALAAIALSAVPGSSQESSYIYGIHDHDPNPQEYLNRFSNQGVNGWVTATFAIGADPNNTSGVNLTWLSSQGHSVIGRINYGYCPTGTIPPSSQYANFATRCANFVQNSSGVEVWVIGNETNLAIEWPAVNGHAAYVSPQNYATCFRQVYNAIKAVRPNAKVIPQALAPWAGPYSAGSTCGFTHDAQPLNWVQYMNQMLTAIKNSGPLDGIALHINSRGYTYGDIHSTQKISAGGQNLYFSFYVYKDWIDLGIPTDLYNLPLYATECNGNYYWSGGHPENPAAHYEAGWMQEIYAEINRYNQSAIATGKPKFRAVCMYRWCNGCDGWNIDGSPYKGQILADLDQAVAAKYTWPGSGGGGGSMIDATPTGTNLALSATQYATDSNYSSSYAGDKAKDGVISAGSKWTSTAASGTHWLKYDLGSNKTVNGFIVRHAGAGGEPTYYNTQQFRLQSSASYNGTYTDEAIVDNNGQASVTTRAYVTPKTLRYVRLYITDAGIDNYARIPEFEVWGAGGGGGTPLTVTENFDSLPSWTSSFDASWGGAATWDVVSGGQSGNALRAQRSNNGSSAKVKVYNITANTNYTVSVYVNCPSATGSYWAECAYKPGSNTAQDFDSNGGSWTMIKKFDSSTNGNGGTWTQYSVSFNSGSNTQISVGFKLGLSSGAAPVVRWDTLRVQ